MIWRPDTPRTWLHKFQDAFRGVALGVRGQRSFWVHVPAALLVVLAAQALQLPPWKWVALVLSIALVMSAELVNSAIEELARAVEDKPNDHIGAALDIAAGAVLLASAGAAAVGLIVFVPELWALWS